MQMQIASDKAGLLPSCAVHTRYWWFLPDSTQDRKTAGAHEVDVVGCINDGRLSVRTTYVQASPKSGLGGRSVCGAAARLHRVGFERVWLGAPAVALRRRPRT